MVTGLRAVRVSFHRQLPQYGRRLHAGGVRALSDLKVPGCHRVIGFDDLGAVYVSGVRRHGLIQAPYVA